MAHLMIMDSGIIAIGRPRLTRGRVVQAVSQRHGGVDEADGIVEAHEPFDAAAVAVAFVAVGHRRRGRVRGGGPVGRSCKIGEGRHHGGRQMGDEVLRLRRELERGQLVDLVLRGVQQPVHHLARLAEAQPVLEVVELDGRRHGQPHAPVAQPLDRPHLAVPVLAAEDPRHAHDPRLRRRRPVPGARQHGTLRDDSAGAGGRGRPLGLGAPGPQLFIGEIAAYHLFIKLATAHDHTW